jgi:pimeloyl-ACP methyl ester carboxylesterase
VTWQAAGVDAIEVALPGRPTLHCLTWSGPADGPAYLLVHGLASNAAMWLGVGDLLADKASRVVAVDLRGHGLSEKPDEGYAIADVVEDLVALIGELGLERPVVAGQSWGGNVAVQLASDHPALVAGVACVDGGWIRLADGFESFEACWEVLAPPTFGVLQYEDLAARVGQNGWPATGVAGVLGCFEHRADGTAVPWLTRERHRLVLRGLYDHDPFLLDVPVPTLLIPTLRNEKAARALAKGIEGARVAPVDGHHDLHAEQPETVAALLQELHP